MKKLFLILLIAFVQLPVFAQDIKVSEANGMYHIILAGNKIRYSLKIYKSKIDEKSLNTTILNTIKILEGNEDTYKDEFPISINPIEYKYEKPEIR